MDLSTVEKKIQKGLYSDMDGFSRDIVLMFNNCLFYNKQGTVYHEVCGSGCIDSIVCKSPLKIYYNPSIPTL